MKKLMEEDKSTKDMRLKAKKDMLSSLKGMMRQDMHSSLKDGLKGKMKVVVSADSPEELAEGVDTAKESLSDMIKAGFLAHKGKLSDSEESPDEESESDEGELDEELAEGEICPKCEGKGCMACGGIAKE